MIALREYQETAVLRLLSATSRLLPLKGNKTVVFRAPTGSGKTVMMAEFLKRLVLECGDERTFSVVWAAPNKLHTQSKNALERYYFDSKALRCLDFDDLTDRILPDRGILFLNWQSINKENNIYIRDNERGHNLSTILENTADDNRTLILVIDESHSHADTPITRALREMFSAKVTIEVSATPRLTNPDEVVPVERERVINEEMIKKSISINPGFRNTILGGLGDVGKLKSEAAEKTNDFVLRMALNQREQLRQAYEDAGSPVNPLLLIQLPDRREGNDDNKDEVISTLKSVHSITEENGRLAIYLSEDKVNLENVTRPDSEVDVMIFKNAIALGWDCPRAAVLLSLRGWHNYQFTTQTIGRIMRMPELRHYEDERLNLGYVFTNVPDLEILEDLAGGYLHTNSSTRSADFEPVTLRSVHAKRHREETRLSPEFLDVFAEAADNMRLKDKIRFDVKGISATLISDATIQNPDIVRHSLSELDFEESSKGEMVERLRSPGEVNRVFDQFVRENLTPYAPEKRSIGRLSEALQRWIHLHDPLKYDLFGLNGQLVVLNKINRQHFVDTINRAKELYDQKVVKGKRELVVNESWQIGQSYTFSNDYQQLDVYKSILSPFFQSKRASNPEMKFRDFLDKECPGVVWWFKNGDQGANNFGVPYKDEHGIYRVFYVDWIVSFKDGRLGLFDTKEGRTVRDAKLKAEALAAYILEENNKGKNLFGGIVLHERGSWRLNDNEVYEYNPSDLSGWKFLDQLVSGFYHSIE